MSDFITQQVWETYFTYLDLLKESGVTNMFGSVPYIQDQFGVSQPEAKKIFKVWMDTFNENETPAERAAKVK
jgi:hypothetical protein